MRHPLFSCSRCKPCWDCCRCWWFHQSQWVVQSLWRLMFITAHRQHFSRVYLIVILDVNKISASFFTDSYALPLHHTSQQLSLVSLTSLVHSRILMHLWLSWHQTMMRSPSWIMLPLPNWLIHFTCHNSSKFFCHMLLTALLPQAWLLMDWRQQHSLEKRLPSIQILSVSTKTRL